MIYIFVLVMIIYVAYTLNFAIKFNNMDTYLNESHKLFHNILIWLIPFFWIMIVKTITRPTPGSAKFKRTKPNAGFYESGIGIWGDSENHHSSVDGGSGGDD